MSSPGHIFLSGIIILQDPRTLESEKGTRNLAFDVNLPIKDGKTKAVGFLRYFIPKPKVEEMQKIWENEFTEAFITAKVCKIQNTCRCTKYVADHSYAPKWSLT